MKRLSPIRKCFSTRSVPLCFASEQTSFPALQPRSSGSFFAFGQLPASYSHVSRSAAQPRHNPTPLLPTIEFAQGPRPPQIAGGFLQGRAFLAWRRGDSRRKKSGEVDEPRR